MKIILILIIILGGLLSLNAEQIVSLHEARELLLNNNPEYLAKESALKAAEWDMHQALTSLFPSARLQGGYNYLDPKPFAGAQENYSISYGINVSQPVFMGGKLWLAYRMKSDAVKIAKADLSYTRLSLLGSLETAYYNYLLSKELYVISQNALDIAERNLETARTRMDTGTLSRAEFLQFQTEVAAKEVALIQAENNRQLSLRQLRNLIKVDISDVLPVDLQLYEELINYYQNLKGDEIEAVKEKLILYGEENNPLLIMTRAGQDISRKAVTLAKGNFLPTVNLSASRNWSDNFRGEYEFDSSTTYLLSLSLPIFPLFDNYSGYRKSYHAYRRTEREVETTEDSIKLAIEAALYTGIASARTISSAELALQYAQETYNMMEERFRNGLISSIDLISIELLLTTSNLNAVQSRYDFLKNRTNLMNLLNLEDDGSLIDIMNNLY
ncbi:MAG: TolC family protein [Candidatus Cloacimonetes bacterium]|nr:TolC family protein [Candidatus Cloacimonadota bacterium]